MTTPASASSAVAILVAGGKGMRFGGATPKQFLEVAGKPLLVHTLRSFARCDVVSRTILVLPNDGFSEASEAMKPHLDAIFLRRPAELAPGGDSRQASVLAGLERVSDEPGSLVVVHDGARPLVTEALIARVVAGASRHGGAIAAVPVVETLKRVSPEGVVVETVDRERYFRAQTPQCFPLGVLREAFERAETDRFLGTDEAALVERLGVPVAIVAGDEQNLKVTRLEDLERVEYYLSQRSD